jgi:hypothetical protein
MPLQPASKRPDVDAASPGLAVSVLQDEEGRTLYVQRTWMGDTVGSDAYDRARLATTPRLRAALDELFEAVVEAARDTLNGK